MGACLGSERKDIHAAAAAVSSSPSNHAASNTGTQPVSSGGGPALRSSVNTSATTGGGGGGGRRRPQQPALSVIDMEIDNRTNNAASEQTIQRKPVLLPISSGFTHSINGRNGWNVNEVYDFSVVLGKGTFGDVWKGIHKSAPNGNHNHHTRGEEWQNVAIKKTAPTVLDRRGGVRIWSYDNVEQRCQEVKTLLRLQEGEPSTLCVLYLFEYFWTYNHSTGQGDLILVTELLGQELDQWRQSQTSIMESSVRQIASVLLNALDFLSSRNVAHRDLKLQNILFRVNGDFRTLKLVDFGLAKVLDGNEKANDFCGSLGYIAPEIYSSKPYRFEVDMFAFGVILFRLLSAQRPFSSANPEKLRSDTINLRYKIEGKNWEGISSDALKLVRNLLIGPEQRYTASQAANHRWFVSQEDSLLVVDYGKSSIAAPDQNGGMLPVDETSHSHVIALSHAPEQPQRDSHVFWLEVATEKAVRLLLAQKQYIGRIVDEPSGERNTGLICLEERAARDITSAEILPQHIAKLETYTERECRNLIREVALIIKQAHDNGLAHRNLLLTNLLVDKKTGRVQIRGLQFAQAVADDQPLTGHFGYLYSWYAFKAPEIDSDFFHDKSVDLWGLGAALYMLLTALPPFRGDGVDLITNKHSGNVVFDTVVPSRSSQRLVQGLLQPNPRNRMTIEQALNSEWMNKSDDELAAHDLSLAHAFMQDF